MRNKYCQNCGQLLSDEENECPKCHYRRGKGIKFCPTCGTQLEITDTKYCPHCGCNIKKIHQISEEKPKSRTVAGLLQLFLCLFGAGRFYLGYYGIALLQILVSLLTLGIGALWPIIDGILIVKGRLKTDAYGNELVE